MSTVAQHLKLLAADQAPLSRRSRLIILTIVALALVADAAIRLSETNRVDPVQELTGTAITLGFALFAWSPSGAVIVLLGLGALALATGSTGEYSFALAIGLAVVAYSARLAFLITYVVGAAIWITWTAIFSAHRLSAGALFALVALATVSATIGLGLRYGRLRERTLQHEITEQSRERELALAAERGRIADELHDIIAHDISLIAMHARALKHIDNERREASEQAIGDAARRALSDIRRVLYVVNGGASAPAAAVHRESVTAAMAAITTDLELAGVTVTADHPAEVTLPASLDSALALVVREAATNIVKHAPDTREARLSLTVTERHALVAVHNGPVTQRKTDLPSSGYGLPRMTERISLLQGELWAGPDDDGWTVRAQLPLS